MKEAFGSVDNYLKEVLGIDEEAKKELRKILLYEEIKDEIYR